MLRPDVPYITVNQNDEGMTGKCELLMQDIPNVLVLSAGGYGHVPIPLFIRPEPENHATPVAQRPYLVSCAPRARAGRTARVRALRAAGGSTPLLQVPKVVRSVTTGSGAESP